MNTQRVIVDAGIDSSVIRGTLTSPAGERRDFHGWLELNTALEAMLCKGGTANLAARSTEDLLGGLVDD